MLEAFKLYSGDKPRGLFADKLEYNLGKLNEMYDDIEAIFCFAGVENFEKLPEDHAERGLFAKLFKRFPSFHDPQQRSKRCYELRRNGSYDV